MSTELKGIKQYKGHNDGENEKYIQIFLWREQVEELYKQLGDWLGVTND